MTCPSCQQPNEPDAAFCGNCGTALAATAAPSPQQPAPPAPAQAVPAAAPGPQSIPSYPSGPVVGTTAAPPLHASPVSGKSGLATASLILGILAIPGAIVPLIGIILAILAIIFGTMSIRSSQKTTAIIGSVLGGTAMVLAIGVIAINYTAIKEEIRQKSEKSSTTPASQVKTTTAIKTQCFESSVTRALSQETVDSEGPCYYQGTDSDGIPYVITARKLQEIHSLSSQQLVSVLQKDATDGLKAIDAQAKLGPRVAGTFKGAASHTYEYTLSNGRTVSLKYVLHDATEYDVVMMMLPGKDAESFYKELEDNWSWK